MRGYIYKIYNDVNEKIYIGQTIQTITGRWSGHKYCYKHGVNNKLYNAMRKYGIENFHICSLEELDNTTREELNQKEIKYIAKFDSYNNGYNSTLGGAGYLQPCKPIKCFTLSGKYLTTYDSYSEAAFAANIEYAALTVAMNSHSESCGGYQWCFEGEEDYIKDYSNSPHTSKVLCVLQYDLSGQFLAQYKTLEAASKATGLENSGISRCSTGQQKYCGNFIWRTTFLGEDFPKKIEPVKINSQRSLQKGKRRAVVMTRDGKDFYFNSLSEAAEKTGFSRHSITYWCDEYPREKEKGLSFHYKKEDD